MNSIFFTFVVLVTLDYARKTVVFSAIMTCLWTTVCNKIVLLL